MSEITLCIRGLSQDIVMEMAEKRAAGLGRDCVNSRASLLADRLAARSCQ